MPNEILVSPDSLTQYKASVTLVSFGGIILSAPRVGLFVTCLVDLYRPNVGFAAIKLLEQSGCEVIVPEAQTCCGQPAFNSGDRASTQIIAQQVIETFESFDYVVLPSGSCAGMLHAHYAELFAVDSDWRKRAEAFSHRCYELNAFLVDVMHFQPETIQFKRKVTYHDACSGLRELGIEAQPRQLLDSVNGISLVEMDEKEVCCGFGGTFCVKYPDISDRMVGDKAAMVVQTGADVLLGGDMGCLLNISGKLSRSGKTVRVYHVAEVLAGQIEDAGIGSADGSGSEPAIDDIDSLPERKESNT